MRLVLLYVLVPLILILLVFYFWGQGANLKDSEHHRVDSISGFTYNASDTLSIMTYNLGYLSGMTNNLPVKPKQDLFDENLKQARALLNKWNPDIVGFQEVDFASRRSYKIDQADSLSMGYAAVVRSVNWDKKYVPFPYWPPSVHFGQMLSGQAVFSKFPILDSERIVLSRPKEAPFYYQAFYLDRLIQVVRLSIRGREVIVLNVHLEAFDEQTREIQATEVLEVVERYADQQPVILIGDFNARPPYASETVSDEQTLDLFLKHPLLSPAIGRERYLAEEQLHFTFDTGGPYEKLDYIFYTHQSIQPLSATTITEAGEISDHLPVLMSFTLLGN